MLSWFDARDAQQFGNTLADFYIERAPKDLDDKKTQKKKQDTVQKLVAQVEIYKVKNKLNLYKKAKLGNAFKWKLLDAGYPESLADELTKIILVSI